MTKSEDFLKDFERIDPISGNNFFHNAVERGDAETVEKYIEWGVNPFIKNRSGKTVLELALDEGIMDLLTDYKEKFEQKVKNATTHVEAHSQIDRNTMELELNKTITKSMGEYNDYALEDDADSRSDSPSIVPQISETDGNIEELEKELKNITAEFEGLDLQTVRGREVSLSEQEMEDIAKSIGILEPYQDFSAKVTTVPALPKSSSSKLR